MSEETSPSKKAKGGKAAKSLPGANAEPTIPLPPAKSIFTIEDPHENEPAGPLRPRVGKLLGIETPTFTHLTSRGFPLFLRPEVMCPPEQGAGLLQLPVSDLLLRQESVAASPGSAQGAQGFWPHLKGHIKYCSYRNPRVNPSVHGGDAVCSVETHGGRRKVGPRELIDTQKVMRADLVACPAEEVPMDVSASRRVQRAVGRAADWLKEILEAKAQEPELNFDWHILASIQGGSDVKQRQKAAAASAAMPVAGYCIGGLGYEEDLGARAKVLEAVCAALPPARPRFLPLNSGNPIEVLQAVLMGVDVLEVPYFMEMARHGLALTFSYEMPAEATSASAESIAEALKGLLPVPEGESRVQAPRAVRQLQLRAPECREDFGPIDEGSPVRQYCRAYLYHLLEVHELLGYMLLAQHNLHVYSGFFAAIRKHIREGTLRQFAAWFLQTQTCEPPAAPPPGPTAKRRKT